MNLKIDDISVQDEIIITKRASDMLSAIPEEKEENSSSYIHTYKSGQLTDMLITDFEKEILDNNTLKEALNKDAFSMCPLPLVGGYTNVADV